jgi:hypothetical protein
VIDQFFKIAGFEKVGADGGDRARADFLGVCGQRASVLLAFVSNMDENPHLVAARPDPSFGHVEPFADCQGKPFASGPADEDSRHALHCQKFRVPVYHFKIHVILPRERRKDGGNQLPGRLYGLYFGMEFILGHFVHERVFILGIFRSRVAY